MGSYRLGAILVILLFLASASALLLSIRYFFTVRELQRIQGEQIRMSQVLNAAQALANDAAEYSKRNPSIDPILYQYDVKPRPPGAPGAPGASSLPPPPLAPPPLNKP